MPLTPFHLGPGLLLGMLTLRIFNLWAILLGSAVMDIEPLILIFVKHCYNCYNHGFWHSILGAIVGSLILATILWILRGRLNKISLRFQIQQSFSFTVLFLSSVIAWLIHILLDSLTHYDVFLLWPLKQNLILIGPQIYWLLNIFLLIFGIIGVVILIKKMYEARKGV